MIGKSLLRDDVAMLRVSSRKTLKVIFDFIAEIGFQSAQQKSLIKITKFQLCQLLSVEIRLHEISFQLITVHKLTFIKALAIF